jgi:hypothetical protein
MCHEGRQQSRSFARWNQSLRRSPNSTGFAKKTDHSAIHFETKPQRQTSCARDTAQARIRLKDANER